MPLKYKPLKSHDDDEFREIRQVGPHKFATLAPAKLNIHLSINGKEKGTNMHIVVSEMQTISLCDYVTLSPVKSTDEGIYGEVVKRNIVRKTMRVLSEHVGHHLSTAITLQKSIPTLAGMGSGSADAAAVLRLANRAFKLNMGLPELEDLASKIGSDVAFLLRGGRAIVAGGKRQQIIPIQVPELIYLIAKPKVGFSTEQMYRLHDKDGRNFTDLAASLCDDTRRLLKEMSQGAMECGVTGKGPTVFAGFPTLRECEERAKKIDWLKGGQIFIERSIGEM